MQKQLILQIFIQTGQMRKDNVENGDDVEKDARSDEAQKRRH